jgi:DNA helicase-2/ATP-dependent DNA helicase PcrA
MLARVHKEKQEGRGPDEMSIDSYLDEAAQKAYVAYEARLRAANAVDFEDLIFRVVRILEAKDGAEPAVREARDALRRRFSHVLVDEFQDTNGTQYRLLRALAERTRNLLRGRRRRSVHLRFGAAPTSATSAASGTTTPTPRW